ncbi:MAG: FAD:protein FMN transferase [Propionibacteriaceae bacterium]|nr:FAD:protein FMN transferase [Propionibacteriaceae bacterium]
MTITRPRPVQLRWQSLGTYVQLSVSDSGKAAAAERRARAMLAAIDRACSRFRPDSELNRVNAGAGTWVRVDPLLVGATIAAVEAAEHTDGIVHPLLGRVLIGLGYDRTFTELQPGRALGARIAPPPLGAWRSLEWAADAVRIPTGTALDLGATAKAWAGDLIARTIAEQDRTNVVLSLGGDVAIATGDRSRTWWPIAISEHTDGEPSAEVALAWGGLATSSTRLRRWTVAGTSHHHLVDPRTGASAQTCWRTVSATGPSATAANIATTAAIILGEDAMGWLTRRGVAARLVSGNGSVQFTPGWPEPGAAA